MRYNKTVFKSVWWDIYKYLILSQFNRFLKKTKVKNPWVVLCMIFLEFAITLDDMIRQS